MYIIFNQDGSIKESQLNDYVNQYSDGVNFIDVVICGMSPDDYTASATYTLPNGENLTDTGVYKSNIATSLGEMQGYRFTLHGAHTQYDGPLTFSLVATKTDKTQLFTYAYGIVINPSAGKKTTEVTWEEYQSLLAQLASYQLRFSSQNVIHTNLTTATGMISVMPVGQVVLVSDNDDETKQDVYVVVSDTTSETGKKLQMVTLGEEGLKSAYVYKEEALGEVQAVHTGLVSHYTDKDDENIAVRYGTDEVDVPAWFVYCLNGDQYSGAITMGAKVFNFYDAQDSNGPWLTNNGNLTKIVSPSRTSKLELETGGAKITSNTIQLGEKLTITNQGEATNFTGAYVSFGSGTTLEIEGDTIVTKDPTNDDNIATKKYVDDVASSSTYKNLNVENGTGGGSIKTKSATGASGVNSVALGLNANATAENSTAIGNGVTNNKANSVAIGYDYTLASTDPYFFAVGQSFLCFGTSLSDTKINSGRLAFTGSSSTFSGDMSVKGTLTTYKLVANEFTSVKAESVSTKQYTIGLAEGNKSKIASYIGLYATAYDGSNYGALVWDNTGTAYVGDAVVNDGVITDPNKTLQPLMTRVDASYLADGCILAWDADNLRASASPYFGISTEYGNCAYMNSPSGNFRVATGDNGVFLIDDGSTPAIELDGKIRFNRPIVPDGANAQVQGDVYVNPGNHVNVDTINSYTAGNALVRYKSNEKVSAFGSSENKALLMGNADRPYYSKDGADFNGEELALKSDVPNRYTFLAQVGSIRQFANGIDFGNDAEVFVLFGMDTYDAGFSFTSCVLRKLVLRQTTASNNALDFSALVNSTTSVEVLDVQSTIKASSITSIATFCRNLKSISLFDTSACTSLEVSFHSCSSLIEIPAFDFSNIAIAENAFAYCQSLEAFHATGMKVSFDIHYSTKFTESALVEILNNLASVSTTQTLTMGSTNLAKLTDDEKAIATDKGWTLA